jgi:hypothetical protein
MGADHHREIISRSRVEVKHIVDVLVRKIIYDFSGSSGFVSCSLSGE